MLRILVIATLAKTEQLVSTMEATLDVNALNTLAERFVTLV